MFRIKLLLIGAGIFLGFTGFKELKVSKGTTVKPVELELADIESGKADTSNAHIKLGSHLPFYYSLIYYGEENTDKVDYVYYPVLSSEHPFILAMDALAAKYPDGNYPESEIPDIGEFSVLVKSKRYSKTDQLPEDSDFEESIQGLVVNKITKLKSEELELLQENYPTLNADKILLLEEGRKPSGAAKKFGMLGGGALLSLLGLGWLVTGRRG